MGLAAVPSNFALVVVLKNSAETEHARMVIPLDVKAATLRVQVCQLPASQSCPLSHWLGTIPSNMAMVAEHCLQKIFCAEI
jgi:hypothetical protein